jgi:tRNA modification GTPase
MLYVMRVPAATYAALLTPPGRGAVATVVVAGPQASRALERLFQSARDRPWAEYAIDEIAFGRWLASGEEVVVCRRAADRIEIHCHGGSAAAEAILTSLAGQGCQVIDAIAWLRHEQPDRLAADAMAALSQTRTARTAAILLDQQAGALRRELRSILAALDAGDLPQAAAYLQMLQTRAAVGRHLVEPFRVVLAGPANVGKSTLINALLGYRRSIVCDQPGTTRDVVTATTAMDGWPVELADTAGLRELPETFDVGVERQGLIRTLEQAAAADVVLLVFDASGPGTSVDALLAAVDVPAFDHRSPLIVYNKCDLSETPPVDGPPGILVSARTGAGLSELLETIAGRLVPKPPTAGAGVPFLPEHVAAIERAQAWLAADDRGAARETIENLCSGNFTRGC